MFTADYRIKDVFILAKGSEYLHTKVEKVYAYKLEYIFSVIFIIARINLKYI